MNMSVPDALSQEIDLPSPSLGKRRLVVGLSWDDAPLPDHDVVSEPKSLNKASEAIMTSPRLEKMNPQTKTALAAPLRFLRHMDIWFQELGNIRNHIKAHNRVSSSSKSDDQPGRDKTFKQRDLDLVCFIFDEKGNFVCEIGPDPDTMVGHKNSIYHSGEEYTGQGTGDDEQIRIEIDSLPDTYCHFVFAVVSDSSLTFEECGTFTLRLADSRTEKSYFESAITAQQSGKHTAYAFCRLTHVAGQWFNTPINHFAQFEPDWHIGLAPKV